MLVLMLSRRPTTCEQDVYGREGAVGGVRNCWISWPSTTSAQGKAITVEIYGPFSSVVVGLDGVLRLHTKTHTEDFPCLHHSLDAESAHTLYCVEQKLSYGVRVLYTSPSPQNLSVCSQLFGEDEDAGSELDVAEKEGENGKWNSSPMFENNTNCTAAQEIATLRREAQAFRTVREALRNPNDMGDAAQLVFQKVGPSSELSYAYQFSPSG